MDQAQYQQVRQNNHFEGEVRHWLEFISDLSPLKLEKNISQILTASCYHRSPLIWLRIDDPRHQNHQPRQLLLS